MITARAFEDKAIAVYGLARSGLATAAALLASNARVTAWDSNSEARDNAPVGSNTRQSRRNRPSRVRQSGCHSGTCPQPASDRLSRKSSRSRNYRRHRAVRASSGRTSSSQGCGHHWNERQINDNRACPSHLEDRRGSDNNGRKHRPSDPCPECASSRPWNDWSLCARAIELSD